MSNHPYNYGYGQYNNSSSYYNYDNNSNYNQRGYQSGNYNRGGGNSRGRGGWYKQNPSSRMNSPSQYHHGVKNQGNFNSKNKHDNKLNIDNRHRSDFHQKKHHGSSHSFSSTDKHKSLESEPTSSAASVDSSNDNEKERLKKVEEDKARLSKLLSSSDKLPAVSIDNSRSPSSLGDESDQISKKREVCLSLPTLELTESDYKEIGAIAGANSPQDEEEEEENDVVVESTDLKNDEDDVEIVEKPVEVIVIDESHAHGSEDLHNSEKEDLVSTKDLDNPEKHLQESSNDTDNLENLLDKPSVNPDDPIESAIDSSNIDDSNEELLSKRSDIIESDNTCEQRFGEDCSTEINTENCEQNPDDDITSEMDLENPVHNHEDDRTGEKDLENSESVLAVCNEKHDAPKSSSENIVVDDLDECSNNKKHLDEIEREIPKSSSENIIDDNVDERLNLKKALPEEDDKILSKEKENNVSHTSSFAQSQSENDNCDNNNKPSKECTSNRTLNFMQEKEKIIGFIDRNNKIPISVNENKSVPKSRIFNLYRSFLRCRRYGRSRNLKLMKKGVADLKKNPFLNAENLIAVSRSPVHEKPSVNEGSKDIESADLISSHGLAAEKNMEVDEVETPDIAEQEADEFMDNYGHLLDDNFTIPLEVLQQLGLHNLGEESLLNEILTENNVISERIQDEESGNNPIESNFTNVHVKREISVESETVGKLQEVHDSTFERTSNNEKNLNRAIATSEIVHYDETNVPARPIHIFNPVVSEAGKQTQKDNEKSYVNENQCESSNKDTQSNLSMNDFVRPSTSTGTLSAVTTDKNKSLKDVNSKVNTKRTMKPITFLLEGILYENMSKFHSNEKITHYKKRLEIKHHNMLLKRIKANHYLNCVVDSAMKLQQSHAEINPAVYSVKAVCESIIKSCTLSDEMVRKFHVVKGQLSNMIRNKSKQQQPEQQHGPPRITKRALKKQLKEMRKLEQQNRITTSPLDCNSESQLPVAAASSSDFSCVVRREPVEYPNENFLSLDKGIPRLLSGNTQPNTSSNEKCIEQNLLNSKEKRVESVPESTTNFNVNRLNYSSVNLNYGLNVSEAVSCSKKGNVAGEPFKGAENFIDLLMKIDEKISLLFGLKMEIYNGIKLTRHHDMTTQEMLFNSYTQSLNNNFKFMDAVGRTKNENHNSHGKGNGDQNCENLNDQNAEKELRKSVVPSAINKKSRKNYGPLSARIKNKKVSSEQNSDDENDSKPLSLLAGSNKKERISNERVEVSDTKPSDQFESRSLRSRTCSNASEDQLTPGKRTISESEHSSGDNKRRRYTAQKDDADASNSNYNSPSLLKSELKVCFVNLSCDKLPETFVQKHVVVKKEVISDEDVNMSDSGCNEDNKLPPRATRSTASKKQISTEQLNSSIDTSSANVDKTIDVQKDRPRESNRLKDSITSDSDKLSTSPSRSTRSKCNKPLETEPAAKKSGALAEPDISSVWGSYLQVNVLKEHEGDLFVGCEDGRTLRLKTKGDMLNHVYSGHDGPVNSIEFFYDYLVTGSSDSTIIIHNLSGYKSLVAAVPVMEPVQTLNVRWQTLYIGSKRGKIFKFSCHKRCIMDKEIVVGTEKDNVLAIHTTREGPRKILIVAAKNQPLTIRDASTGLLLRSVNFNDVFYSLAFYGSTPCGYCGTRNNSVVVIDFTTGEKIDSLNLGKNVIKLLIKWDVIFTASYDGFVHIYNFNEKQLLAKYPVNGLIVDMELWNNKIIISTSNQGPVVINFPKALIKYLTEKSLKILESSFH